MAQPADLWPDADTAVKYEKSELVDFIIYRVTLHILYFSVSGPVSDLYHYKHFIYRR